MYYQVLPVSSLRPMPLPENVEVVPEWFGSGFAADMAFLTSDGPVPAAWLRPGDMVQTYDNGMQPLALVEQQVMDSGPMIQSPDIASGAMLPAAQRALITGWEVELHFGHAEMLVTLGAIKGVRPRKMISAQSTYILAFEQPQLIHCDGLWLEASSMAAERPVRPHMTGIEARTIGVTASHLQF